MSSKKQLNLQEVSFNFSCKMSNSFEDIPAQFPASAPPVSDLFAATSAGTCLLCRTAR